VADAVESADVRDIDDLHVQVVTLEKIASDEGKSTIDQLIKTEK
jgi:hypothetical protein